MPSASRRSRPEQPYYRVVVAEGTPQPAPSCIPFAGIVDVVLPLLERRTAAPIFSCRKCGHTWSASLETRHTYPQSWWACPNRCDTARTIDSCG